MLASLETKLESMHIAYFRQTSSSDRAELKRIATAVIYEAELRGMIPHTRSERLADSVRTWDTFQRIA